MKRAVGAWLGKSNSGKHRDILSFAHYEIPNFADKVSDCDKRKIKV